MQNGHFDQLEAIIYKFPVAGKTNPIDPIEIAATDEQGAQPTGEATGAKSTSLGFLGAGRQNFTPEDFKNPAVAPIIVRFLLDACEKHELEKADLRAEYKSLRISHDEKGNENITLKVDLSELKGKTKNLTANELLYFICSAAGAAGFPVMMAIKDLKGGHDWGVDGMAICAALIVGSIVLRAWALFK